MKSYQVIRTDISPYQSQDFLAQEEAIISALGPFNYQTLMNFTDQETILITNTHTRLRELPPALLQNTRLIIHPNSGYDHFESDHEFWKNIPLVVGHRIRAQAVTEYSIGAVFEGLLELPQHLNWHEKRSWNRTLLKGSSVWIFGYGHIGKIIADSLKTLGMKVTIVDPYKEGALASWKDGDISEARVIIAAVGLNQQTKLMFNQDFFSRLGEKVLFINGARGKLVDEQALKDYLLSNPEAFAFLDVFQSEPFGEDWIGFPQVWKTSHIAGVEKDLDQKILDFEVEVINDHQKLNQADFFRKYTKELLQNKWIKGVLI
jgi:D-3-phosphoglycerate dehydrogenase